MKKLMKWIIPAILGIVPTWGMQLEQGEIKDPFFTKEGTVVSVRMAYESGQNVMLMVDATDTKKSESKKVIADCAPLGWYINDTKKVGQEKVLAQVVCGTQMLEKEYTKRQEHPYQVLTPTGEVNLFNGNVVNNLDAPLGELVNVCNETIYKRPNESQFVDREPLYEGVFFPVQEGKALETDNLLNTLPLNTPVNVIKIKAGVENFSEGAVVYQLLLEEVSNTRTAWVCTKEETQTVYNAPHKIEHLPEERFILHKKKKFERINRNDKANKENAPQCSLQVQGSLGSRKE